MYMLHKMSEFRGWSHEEMMRMPKEVFFRYYGYWYTEIYEEAKEIEKREREAKRQEMKNRPKQWKSLK